MKTETMLVLAAVGAGAAWWWWSQQQKAKAAPAARPTVYPAAAPSAIDWGFVESLPHR